MNTTGGESMEPSLELSPLPQRIVREEGRSFFVVVIAIYMKYRALFLSSDADFYFCHCVCVQTR